MARASPTMKVTAARMRSSIRTFTVVQFRRIHASLSLYFLFFPSFSLFFLSFLFSLRYHPSSQRTLLRFLVGEILRRGSPPSRQSFERSFSSVVIKKKKEEEEGKENSNRPIWTDNKNFAIRAIVEKERERERVRFEKFRCNYHGSLDRADSGCLDKPTRSSR